MIFEKAWVIRTDFYRYLVLVVARASEFIYVRCDGTYSLYSFYLLLSAKWYGRQTHTLFYVERNADEKLFRCLWRPRHAPYSHRDNNALRVSLYLYDASHSSTPFVKQNTPLSVCGTDVSPFDTSFPGAISLLRGSSPALQPHISLDATFTG